MCTLELFHWDVEVERRSVRGAVRPSKLETALQAVMRFEREVGRWSMILIGCDFEIEHRLM